MAFPAATKKQRATVVSGEPTSAVVPSDDRAQLVLLLMMERSGLGAPWLPSLLLLHRTCSSFKKELAHQGFCYRTAALCSALASGGNSYSQVSRLFQNISRRLEACTDPTERALFMDARALVQKCTLWAKGEEGSVRKWLQAAYQEPDSSFLSQGAAATADVLAANLVRWPAKPQERHAGLRTLPGHGDTVNCVEFSADGTRTVSGSKDKTIKIWEVSTGAEVRTLTGHRGNVNSVRFSADGKRVVSGAYDGLVKIWNAETGQEVRTLAGHTGGVLCVCMSADGKRVVSGSYDNTVKIWNAATGQEVRTLSGHTRHVHSVCFSPDGTRVVSKAFDHLVKLWNAETGQEVRTFTGHSGGLNSVRFSPDGTRVISAADEVEMWDTASGVVVGRARNVGSKVSLVMGPRARTCVGRGRTASTSKYHVVSARQDELVVFAMSLREDGFVPISRDTAPLACFMSPAGISAVGCHGTAICVGCSDGSVILLQAPFLEASATGVPRS